MCFQVTENDWQLNYNTQLSGCCGTICGGPGSVNYLTHTPPTGTNFMSYNLKNTDYLSFSPQQLRRMRCSIANANKPFATRERQTISTPAAYRDECLSAPTDTINKQVSLYFPTCLSGLKLYGDKCSTLTSICFTAISSAATSGIFDDGSLPGTTYPYDSNVYCTKTLAAPLYATISLSFNYFITELNNDVLRIYDSSVLVRSFSGSLGAPINYESTTNILTIIWQTNANVQYDG